MKMTILFLITALCFAGCSMAGEDSRAKVNIRMILETKESSAGQAQVFLEGPDGNYLTGSRVMIVNNGGSANLLRFNLDEGCYLGDIPLSSEGEYTFLIDSALLGDLYRKTVGHFVINESPDITLLRDSSGASALSGETLSLSHDLQIGWNESARATVYQIRLYKNGTLVHTETCRENSALLPAEALSGTGSYTCQIKAQYIGGDPLLIEENYYSYSEKRGASVYFTEE